MKVQLAYTDDQTGCDGTSEFEVTEFTANAIAQGLRADDVAQGMIEVDHPAYTTTVWEEVFPGEVAFTIEAPQFAYDATMTITGTAKVIGG